MSAFIVNKSHIDAMLRARLGRAPNYLSWYHKGTHHQLTIDNADQVGQMLLGECVRSVSYRYPNDPLTELPGRTDAEWIIPYTFYLMGRRPTPVQALKLISCYKYQSCEHPEWESSEAQAFCEALTATLIQNLPGYEEAPWEWEEERPATRPQLTS